MLCCVPAEWPLPVPCALSPQPEEEDYPSTVQKKKRIALPKAEVSELVRVCSTLYTLPSSHSPLTLHKYRATVNLLPTEASRKFPPTLVTITTILTSSRHAYPLPPVCRDTGCGLTLHGQEENGSHTQDSE